MKQVEYWRKRAEILKLASEREAETYLEEAQRGFDKALYQMQKDIDAWYQRFAKNNQITLAEAKRLLQTRELEELRWDVEQYINAGQSLDPKWKKKLENASARVHISRLEALQLQLQQHIEVLYKNQLDELDEVIRKIYSEEYYQMIFEVQKGIGVGWDIARLDTRRLDLVLKKPWTTDGQTFSDRIWKNRDTLVNEVYTELVQTMIRGDAPNKTADRIAKQMHVAKSSARRLVVTETAYFTGEAQKDAYRELGVQQFEIVETLDTKTCAVCQPLDGKVLPMSQYEVGVTAPPFHPNCRGATAPYFEDDDGERIARDADGKTYYVPGNMTYAQWKKEYITKPAELWYNTFKADVHKQIKNSYPMKVNIGMQNKHIRGSKNFDSTRSELTADPGELIQLYAGKSLPQTTKSGVWNQKERFTHTSEIGVWKDLHGREAPTKEGIFHYSKKNGIHVVPARPRKEVSHD